MTERAWLIVQKKCRGDENKDPGDENPSDQKLYSPAYCAWLLSILLIHRGTRSRRSCQIMIRWLVNALLNTMPADFHKFDRLL